MLILLEECRYVRKFLAIPVVRYQALHTEINDAQLEPTPIRRWEQNRKGRETYKCLAMKVELVLQLLLQNREAAEIGFPILIEGQTKDDGGLQLYR